MWHEEWHALADGTMVEILLARDRGYRLRYGRPGSWSVCYENHRRSVNGRGQAYELRSVEQLRYDFERDVAQARRQG